jgi:hypothetical protein
LLASATPRDVRRWRESEIIHGRVSMLASVGFIVGENLEDFPAFYVSGVDWLVAGVNWSAQPVPVSIVGTVSQPAQFDSIC